MSTTKEFGNLGEHIACRYLEGKGYKILDRNFISKFISGPQRGEIDIVAQKEGVISFVEVKLAATTQKTAMSFAPEDRVNFTKQRKLIKTSQEWLVKNKLPLDSPWQIDVIALRIDRTSHKAHIRHLQNTVAS